MTEHPVTNPTAEAPEVLGALLASRYAELRTYRRSGEPVDTPVWFASDGEHLWFRTPIDAAKVRRIERNSSVELRPCQWNGGADGPPVRGVAHVLERSAAARPERLLAARYGWQWNVVPLVRVPGTRSVHHGGGIRAKLRLARARTLWADSCIVQVKLEPAGSNVGGRRT